MEREKLIEGYLRRQVEARGGVCMKFISPGNDGVPDRVIILPPARVYFAELKTKAGRLSRIQRFQLKRMWKLGQTCSVVCGMDGAKQYIHDLDKGQVGLFYGANEDDL